jgi:hypothetical protein
MNRNSKTSQPDQRGTPLGRIMPMQHIEYISQIDWIVDRTNYNNLSQMNHSSRTKCTNQPNRTSRTKDINHWMEWTVFLGKVLPCFPAFGRLILRDQHLICVYIYVCLSHFSTWPIFMKVYINVMSLEAIQNGLLSNFLQSVLTTWRTYELLRWGQH